MITSALRVDIEDYVDAVLGGDIPSGRPLIQAAERWRRDLARERTDAFPYYLDWQAAEGAVSFFPSFCQHSSGIFAGQPFELEPWQKFGIVNTFGWKRLDNACRRFRRILWEMGRKNGKTTLGAGICLLCGAVDVNPFTGTPESRAEIYIAGTKREQARVMDKELRAMRARSGFLAEISLERREFVRFLDNESEIRTLSSDKSFDGLNPHLVCLDEIHAYTRTQRKFYDTMQTGSGSRAQPLTITFTTAGDENSEIWLEEYDYAKGVLEESWADERFFPYVFEMDDEDDVFDASLWQKSNPNLGVSVSVDYLEEQAAKFRRSATGIARFTRYHANRKIVGATQAFEVEEWDKGAGELSDWAGSDAIGGGFDLGGMDDFCAWAQVARFETGEVEPDENENPVPIYRYEIRAQNYVSAETERDLSEQPWAEWIHEDQLLVSEEPNTDLSNDLLQACGEFGIDSIAYDPWGGLAVAEAFKRRGITVGKMAQSTAHFNEPIKEFRKALGEGRIRHDGSSILRKQIVAAVTRMDSQEKEQLSKRDSAGKIDALVAILMAFQRARLARPKAKGPLFVA